MKTKEVIRQLLEADPTGEEEVSVGNCDIYYVDSIPSYYDGNQKILIRDESKNCYNVVGVKVREAGRKIVINTLSLEDALYTDPNLPVDLSELSPVSRQRYEEFLENTRKEVEEMEVSLHKLSFTQWAEKVLKVDKLSETQHQNVMNSYDELGLYHKDSDGFSSIGSSIRDKENADWSEKFYVYENGKCERKYSRE